MWILINLGQLVTVTYAMLIYNSHSIVKFNKVKNIQSINISSNGNNNEINKSLEQQVLK